MKLNNKGFAISTIMYMILILAVILILATLSILGSRKLIIDKVKDETYNNIYRMHLARENVEAVINPTINGAPVGITPEVDTNGNIVPGSTFKIKVNDADTDGSIFYVLSNDGEYVNLIAQQNITIDGTFTSEPQDNDEWYVTSQDNRYGPQTAYTYLNKATNNWTNIPIIQNLIYEDEGHKINSDYGYQGIKTIYDRRSENYITTITPLSTDYGNPVTYKNMRARLPYVSEITENTTCEVNVSTTNNGSCPIWMVNYLYTTDYYLVEDGKINSTGANAGYWLLSSYSDDSNGAHIISYVGYVYKRDDTDYVKRGVRPVITVLKSDLVRVMNLN